MPLTPADVHNVAFSKPPIGKRGYNEDEVDAFLDLVEQELSRLIEENADLRQRVAELDAELADAKKNRGPAPQNTVKAPVQQAPPSPEPIKPQVPVAPPAPLAAAVPVAKDGPGAECESASRQGAQPRPGDGGPTDDRREDRVGETCCRTLEQTQSDWSVTLELVPRR